MIGVGGRIAIFLLAIFWWAGDAQGKCLCAQELSTNHPIYKFRSNLQSDQNLGLEQPVVEPVVHLIGNARKAALAGEAGSPLPEKDPNRCLRWNLAVTKSHFKPSEPVWAKLTVENLSVTHSFSMSPPFHGNFVSTLGVWERHQFEGKENCSELVETCAVNKGAPIRRVAYCGRPLILKPGESYGAWIPLNMLQQPTSFTKSKLNPRCCWIPNDQFSNPGKYRIYLRYVNLDRWTSVPDEKIGGSSNSEPKKAASDIIRFPRNPVILAPVDVEIIEPLKKKTSTEFWQFCDTLKKQIVRPSDDKIGFFDITIDKRKQSLLSLISGDTISPSLQLMIAKQCNIEFENEDAGDEKGQIQKIKFLKSLISSLDESAPLHSFATVELCQQLVIGGQRDAAMDVAKGVSTPDGQVLVDQFKANFKLDE